jgi:hypothetical protein
MPSSSPPTMPLSSSSTTPSGASSSSSREESARLSSCGSVEPSNMCDWNSGSRPAATRRRDSAISGRTNASNLPGGAWSVCSAIATG